MSQSEIERILARMDKFEDILNNFLLDNATNKVENQANTDFRKNAINGIVGTAFVALCALGIAILKATNILKI